MTAMTAVTAFVAARLGGLPFMALRGLSAMLWAAIKTPVGAGVLALSLGLVVGEMRGAARIEARHRQAEAVAAARRDAYAAADRRDAKADAAQLATAASDRRRAFEEMSDVPLPVPRPGDRGIFDGRRLR